MTDCPPRNVNSKTRDELFDCAVDLKLKPKKSATKPELARMIVDYKKERLTSSARKVSPKKSTDGSITIRKTVDKYKTDIIECRIKTKTVDVTCCWDYTDDPDYYKDDCLKNWKKVLSNLRNNKNISAKKVPFIEHKSGNTRERVLKIPIFTRGRGIDDDGPGAEGSIVIRGKNVLKFIESLEKVIQP